MSQIQFEVSLLSSPTTENNNNQRIRNINVQADDVVNNLNRNKSTLGLVHLPCSPIAPANIILKNEEKFPVLYKIFVEQQRRKRRPQKIQKKRKDDDDDDNNNEDNDEQEQNISPRQSIMLYPTKGSVKAGEVVSIAVLLPPPSKGFGDSAAAKNQSAMKKSSNSSNNNRSNSPSSQQQRQVRFANDEQNLFSTNNENELNDDGVDLKAFPPIRVRIEATLLLSGGAGSNLIAALKKKQEQDEQQQDDEDSSDAGTSSMMVAASSPTNENENGGDAEATSSSSSFHLYDLGDGQEKVTREVFDKKFETGLRLPSYTIAVTSVKPAVSRREFLELVIDGKMKSCEELWNFNNQLQSRYEKSLREISDFREAQAKDRVEQLERNNVVMMPSWCAILGVVGSFLIGFQL